MVRCSWFVFFFQAEDGIRDRDVTGVQTCALPIWDVQAERRVAFVVDDLASIQPWVVRGIEIRGTADAIDDGGQSLGPGFGTEMIRITRSEERRVGKEGRSRGGRGHGRKKAMLGVG